MSLRQAYDHVLERRTIADPRKDIPWPLTFLYSYTGYTDSKLDSVLPGAASLHQEFLDQLGIFECELFGFATPTLTGEEIFAHRNLLNVDDDPLCFGLAGQDGGCIVEKGYLCYLKSPWNNPFKCAGRGYFIFLISYVLFAACVATFVHAIK